jgi:hypothetical protein
VGSLTSYDVVGLHGLLTRIALLLLYVVDVRTSQETTSEPSRPVMGIALLPLIQEGLHLTRSYWFGGHTCKHNIKIMSLTVDLQIL